MPRIDIDIYEEFYYSNVPLALHSKVNEPDSLHNPNGSKVVVERRQTKDGARWASYRVTKQSKLKRPSMIK